MDGRRRVIQGRGGEIAGVPYKRAAGPEKGIGKKEFATAAEETLEGGEGANPRDLMWPKVDRGGEGLGVLAWGYYRRRVDGRAWGLFRGGRSGGNTKNWSTSLGALATKKVETSQSRKMLC